MVSAISASFSFDLSWSILPPHLPKYLQITSNLFLKCSSVSRSFLFFGKTLSHSFLRAFHLLWPNFWDLLKNLGFLQNFGMGFVYLILKHHTLHHMCIITMFHAFICVFTLLQWLYAARFGLGWAHDVFKFACQMFMHFHAYVPLNFYILIYIILLVLFLIVSLSPFISLSWVSCFMAPKRKSTPS